MRYQTILLKFAGMCYTHFERYLPKKLEGFSVVLNWTIFGFFSFVHIHLAVLFFLEMIRSSTLEVITNAITMVIINVFAFFTLLYYKLNNKRYLQMVEFMNTRFLRRSAYGLTFMTAERSYIVANRYVFWWTTMCLQGTLQWVIIPLFASTRTLPIELKYPVDEMVCTKELIFSFKPTVNSENIELISFPGWSLLSNYLLFAQYVPVFIGNNLWKCRQYLGKYCDYRQRPIWHAIVQFEKCSSNCNDTQWFSIETTSVGFAFLNKFLIITPLKIEKKKWKNSQVFLTITVFP